MSTPPESSIDLLLTLLGEARAGIAELQSGMVKVREQTWETTRNLELRIRGLEALHSALLYLIAGAAALGALCAGIGLVAVAIALFRILEALP